MRRALAAALLCLLALPVRGETSAFLKQALGQVGGLLGKWRPEVGGWVQYRLTTPVLPGPREYRVACIKKVAAGPQGVGYWLEAVEFEGGMPAVVGCVLVFGDPRRPLSVRRLQIWLPPQPPFELPPEELAQIAFGGGACGADGEVGCLCSGGKKRALGRQTIETAVGRFPARGYRVTAPDGRRIESWFSDRVPLLGLVRQTSSDGVTWELVGTGQDAKRSFPEDVPVIDLEAMRRFTEKVQALQAAQGEDGAPRDEAHGGTDPLGDGVPLPP